MNVLASLLLLGSAASPSPAPAAASLSGTWLVNGARLELKQDGATVIGELGAPGGPCAVPVGTELLRGSLLDDSLAAQVRLCLLHPSCASETGSAMAVLLVTTQLTGGVHAQAPCAAEVRALTLRRPGAAPPAAPPLNTRLSRTPPPRHPAVSSSAAPLRTAERARLTVRAPPRNATASASGAGAASPGADSPVRTEVDGPDALLLRGLTELHEGRIEAARKLFREALRKQPGSAEAYNGVGVTFYARGDFEEALAWYKRALEADPRFGDAYYNMACLYALQGAKPLALRYLRLAALNHYSDEQQLQGDPDLASLRGDPQLRELIEQMSDGLKPSSAAKGSP